MSDTHSMCSMNFIYYFYCLLPLTNHNINQSDKIRKKLYKGKSVHAFKYTQPSYLFNCAIIYCYAQHTA